MGLCPPRAGTARHGPAGGAPWEPRAMAIATLKRTLPWWAKMGARVVVSRLPVDYGVWRSLSVFRFGGMEKPAWAYEIFRRHLEAARLTDLHGRSVLELGPGDSL